MNESVTVCSVEPLDGLVYTYTRECIVQKKKLTLSDEIAEIKRRLADHDKRIEALEMAAMPQ